MPIVLRLYIDGQPDTPITNAVIGAPGPTVDFNLTDFSEAKSTADGASAQRSMAARSAGEVMSAAEFGLVANADPSVFADASVRMLDFVASHGGRVFTLPRGPINFGVPAANLVGVNEGAAIKLLGQHSNICIRGVPGTVLKPVSNKIEMFAQAGATDVTLEDIVVDNLANGVLQNQPKTTIGAIGGGVASLGNGANAFIRQYSGSNLTLRRCTVKGFATIVHYIGDWTDISKLAGTLIVDDCEFDEYVFGVLAEQVRVLRLTGLRSRNRSNSVNSDLSVDPGHDLYLTNRPGANPNLVLVDNVLAEGRYNATTGLYSDASQSSSIKIRKGENVIISNVGVHNCGKGVEVFNSRNVVLSNCSVKLAEDDDTNQAAYELTDCGSIEFSNLIADIQGIDAWGLRVRTDQNSKPFHNRQVTGDRIKVICNYDGASNGKAPIFIADQIDVELRYPRIEHHGNNGNAQYPIDIRGCLRAHIVHPSHRTPDGAADAYKLVQFDAATSNSSVIYKDHDIDVAVTSNTVRNFGTNNEVVRIGGSGVVTMLEPDGSLQVDVAGSVAAPAIGFRHPASGDYFGEYRSGSGQVGKSVNGALVAVWTSTRQIAYGNINPDTAGERDVGGAAIPFNAMYAETVQAIDLVNGWTATVTPNALTFSRGGTNYIQSSVSGSGIAINAQFRTSMQYQGTDIFRADSDGATIGAIGGKVGFYGAAGAAKQALAAVASDAASTQALANDIRSKLIAVGLMS